MILGYNPIQTLGILLNGAVLIALALLYVHAWRSGIPGIQTLSAYLYMALCVYLIAQTTLHPWYLIPLLPLALLSGMRAAIPWTAIAFLSYIHYGSYPEWVEHVCRWVGYGSLIPFLWADAQKLRLRYFTSRH
ncbi:hypothetical protein A3SI_10469 [Nitritalea halalkaliphila LW7]|uniref:Integral membrane protein n=1 Tax=Nitritalea halalkaliphila LW7 TaxID=1189621 RepID=I5C3M8_9BACT|nr:hypothetical protein [Nitritalea halalkaliphila]EIM76430.1 hypothetical protein A3SI_10469 [Nitritalea halalkaliphila LW7]